MAKPRKTAEDWIKAGFRALAKQGPEALRIEPIARSLGTTKGSFYWHFKDQEALRRAMITYWRAQATEAIITAAKDYPEGRARLTALFEMASETPQDVGGPVVETALRHWGQTYAPMQEALMQADAQRLGFLKDALKGLVQDPEQAARLIYTAHLGQQALDLAPKTAIKDLQTLVSSL